MKYCPLRAKAKRIFISIFCLISLQFTRTMNIITHYGSSTSWNSNEHAINCSISFIWCKNDVFWVMQKSSQKRNFNRTHFTNNTTQYIYKDIINNTWMISCVCCVIVDFCTCLIVCFLISFLTVCEKVETTEKLGNCNGHYVACTLLCHISTT